MSEQPSQKVTFTLRGDGITVTYSPSDGTMDGTMDVEGFGVVSHRQFHFAGYEIVTTRDDFGILATVPAMTWRNGSTEFLTLAVPNGLPRSDGNASGGADPSSSATAVKAIAIVQRGRWEGTGRPEHVPAGGWTVTALDGTVAVTG